VDTRAAIFVRVWFVDTGPVAPLGNGLADELTAIQQGDSLDPRGPLVNSQAVQHLREIEFLCAPQARHDQAP
jgi:hypothetical protein